MTAWHRDRHHHRARPVEVQLDRVALVIVDPNRRDMYESTCLAAGHEWQGLLTAAQALLIQHVGVRCGWRSREGVRCGSFTEVVPVLKGSIGSVQTTTVAQGLAMRKRGGPQAA